MRLRIGGLAIIVAAVLAGCGDGKVTLPRDQERQPRCTVALNQNQTLPTITTLPGTKSVTITIYRNCKP